VANADKQIGVLPSFPHGVGPLWMADAGDKPEKRGWEKKVSTLPRVRRKPLTLLRVWVRPEPMRLATHMQRMRTMT
jgi:hypothetical protein